jgi:DNA-3-methyladenine glycosylase I
LIEEVGTLAAHVWSFEPDRRSRPATLDAEALMGLGVAPEAQALSKDLKRRGWSFVGPTTVYSAMESIGLVNDHVDACYIRTEVAQARGSFVPPGRG